jgi:hypothetical protein
MNFELSSKEKIDLIVACFINNIRVILMCKKEKGEVFNLNIDPSIPIFYFFHIIYEDITCINCFIIDFNAIYKRKKLI